jgi:ribulose 1,5-bisphosphate synthetase/thiazole synthase
MNTSPLTLEEPSRQTPVLGEYDVVILGGGPAGIMAATSAARAGSRTILVERYGFLGGMGTAAGVTNFCGLHANVFGAVTQVVHGLTDELLLKMRQMGGLSEPHSLFGNKIAAQAYDNAVFKVAADELVLKSGAQILFHSLAVGVIMSSTNHIQALLVETKSGRKALKGKVFIDCSGDADLCAFSGAAFEKGRDSEQGEDMMFPSTMFRVNGVDASKAGDAWNHFGELMEKAEKDGLKFPRKTPIIRPQKNPSEWRANVTQLANPDGTPVDGTNAVQLSYAETLGRKQIVEFLGFLKSYAPGFENAYLLEIAPQVGIRETRRVTGEYQLNENDVMNCASFEDTIGVNAWMIEEHVAGNIQFKWQDIPNCRGFNHLPFRMMIPKGQSNLLVAGRCASMTHAGQSAARVSGACFVMGQAAGTAASMAVAGELSTSEINIEHLQRELSRSGVYLGLDH